jgi:hypothetical protein
VANTHNQSSSGAVILDVLTCLGIAWAGWVFISPSQKLDNKDSPEVHQALDATYTQVAFRLSRAEIRLEPMQGDNLDIFLTTPAFESIPYPDRSRFLDQVADAWCGNVDGFFLPSVMSRDIKTGEELATRVCLFHSTK